MRLATGARLGEYEIVALIGSGGMGEVYRARDPRIERDVAIKILPPSFATDPDRLRRFEAEARTAGMLNHPNLLTIFELGMHVGSPFIVSELLDGATLRDSLGSGLSARKSIEYALQIAAGLAAAHDKGIVHRDLKPENIFITSDDRVKLLDFGLAKVVAEREGSDAPTVQQGTSPGTIVGTTAYMSPEQARARPVDQRSDIFSFGVVLYEMIAGAQPFRRDSSADTLTAILKEDPPPIRARSTPPALERIIHHALEKNPARRFQSARDVAFALEMVSGSGESAAAAPKSRRKSAVKPSVPPQFQRITYRRGTVMTARFAPDGSAVYGGAWEDGPLELLVTHPGNPESRALALPEGDLLDISPSGELAVSLGRHFVSGFATSGTLARVPFSGGAPREVAEAIQDAVWGPDGKTLLVSRRVGDVMRLEYPIGNVIHQSHRWLSRPRFSPRGDMIAFFEHPIWGNDEGQAVIIDMQAHERVRSRFFTSNGGMIWNLKGDEVIISGEPPGRMRDIFGLTLSGKERVVLPSPGRFTLHDINRNGDLLLSYENARREIMGGTRGEPRERNLSWFDWSFPTALSRDGDRIILEEHGSAKKTPEYLVYARPTDGGPAVRIGEGRGTAISADGKNMLLHARPPNRLELMPIGAGEPRLIPTPGLEDFHWYEFAGDSGSVVVLGNEPSRADRLYLLPIDGSSPPKPISGEGTYWPFFVSNGGTLIVAVDQRLKLLDLHGTEREVPGARPEDRPAGWSADDSAIFVYRSARLSVDIHRLDITTGERTLWHTIRPADPAGIMDIQPVRVAANEKAYVYGFRRVLSDLLIASGVL